MKELLQSANKSFPDNVPDGEFESLIGDNNNLIYFFKHEKGYDCRVTNSVAHSKLPYCFQNGRIYQDFLNIKPDRMVGVSLSYFENQGLEVKHVDKGYADMLGNTSSIPSLPSYIPRTFSSYKKETLRTKFLVNKLEQVFKNSSKSRSRPASVQHIGIFLDKSSTHLLLCIIFQKAQSHTSTVYGQFP